MKKINSLILILTLALNPLYMSRATAQDDPDNNPYLEPGEPVEVRQYTEAELKTLSELSPWYKRLLKKVRSPGTKATARQFGVTVGMEVGFSTGMKMAMIVAQLSPANLAEAAKSIATNTSFAAISINPWEVAFASQRQKAFDEIDAMSVAELQTEYQKSRIIRWLTKNGKLFDKVYRITFATTRGVVNGTATAAGQMAEGNPLLGSSVVACTVAAMCFTLQYWNRNFQNLMNGQKFFAKTIDASEHPIRHALKQKVQFKIDTKVMGASAFTVFTQAAEMAGNTLVPYFMTAFGLLGMGSLAQAKGWIGGIWVTSPFKLLKKAGLRIRAWKTKVCNRLLTR